MKTAILFYLFTVLPSFSFNQDIDSVVLGTNHYKLRLGDTIVIGLPSGKANQFLFVSDDITKLPVIAESFTGTGESSRDIKTTTSDKLIQDAASRYADKNVDESQIGSIWIRNENLLTHKILRIVRFDHYIDADGRKCSFAIGETKADEKFRVNLEGAIYSGELSSHNSKMFENFVIKTKILSEVE